MSNQELPTNSAFELGQLLTLTNQVIGTAESCTGGLIASAITDVPGSSAWFEEGLVTYANTSKSRLLNVDETVLEQHGAVSECVVKAMVMGVLARGADIAIATSGIAGPDGGTATKPVGTVWFAWGSNERQCSAVHVFSGDRMSVRQKATEYAIQQLIIFLKSTV
jgi:nicotinamide-nucleotide amidase